MLKRSFLISNIMLFAWFTLDMTGLHLFGVTIVNSAMFSIDGVFWVIYASLFYRFIKEKKHSVISITIFYWLWGILQYFNALQYSIFPNKDRIESYNDYFKDTLNLFSPSADRLIPDFWHTILFTLIFVNMIIGIVVFVKKKNINK